MKEFSVGQNRNMPIFFSSIPLIFFWPCRFISWLPPPVRSWAPVWDRGWELLMCCLSADISKMWLFSSLLFQDLFVEVWIWSFLFCMLRVVNLSLIVVLCVYNGRSLQTVMVPRKSILTIWRDSLASPLAPPWGYCLGFWARGLNNCWATAVRCGSDSHVCLGMNCNHFMEEGDLIIPFI